MPRGYRFTITHLLGLPYLPLRHQFKYAFDFPFPLCFSITLSLFLSSSALGAVLFFITLYDIMVPTYNATWCPSFSLSILTIPFVQRGKSKLLNVIFTATLQLNER